MIRAEHSAEPYSPRADKALLPVAAQRGLIERALRELGLMESSPPPDLEEQIAKTAELLWAHLPDIEAITGLGRRDAARMAFSQLRVAASFAEADEHSGDPCAAIERLVLGGSGHLFSNPPSPAPYPQKIRV